VLERPRLAELAAFECARELPLLAACADPGAAEPLPCVFALFAAPGSVRFATLLAPTARCVDADGRSSFGAPFADAATAADATAPTADTACRFPPGEGAAAARAPGAGPALNSETFFAPS
jgi:hypothetical protein